MKPAAVKKSLNKTPADVRGRLLFGGLALLFAKPASACPICHSETGELVRAGIFNGNFWGTLFTAALPFPILAAIVVGIYYGWPDRKPPST